ncbi:MAG: hypothetical protein MR283_08995 [Erysipelotrichaceae bacterium]|nr:hypothetical protein [Erysipelotrichaceae bacterium]MDY6034860.1 hypothetical protein [Bulleidia sp.]
MFNEMKRYIRYKKRYLFDNVCEVIYSLIFITGIIVIFNNNTPINILYFFLYYVMTNTILLANEELEYEIRTNQYINIKTTKTSVLKIYLYRSVTYLLWSTFIFVIAIAVALLFFPSKFILPVISLGNLALVVLVNLGIMIVLYILAIKLTERYQRVAVFLNLMNTLVLFYSGLVFPVSFFSYVNLLNLLAGI